MTSRNRTVLLQAKGGLRLLVSILLVLAWFGAVIAGMAIALTPSSYSPLVGWGLLLFMAIVLILTMDRWVKVLPGILGYGIFGGLFTIVSGHALNQPSVHVPRIQAMIMTVVIAVSAWVSFTFTKRKLDLLDRIAVFGFIFCFFWQLALRRFVLFPFVIGSCLLVTAWACRRLWRGSRADGRVVPSRSSDRVEF